jgi:hypothetical protein
MALEKYLVVRMDEAELKQWKEYAKAKKLPLSVLIRAAVRWQMEEYPIAKKKRKEVKGSASA